MLSEIIIQSHKSRDLLKYFMKIPESFNQSYFSIFYQEKKKNVYKFPLFVIVLEILNLEAEYWIALLLSVRRVS